MSLQPNITRSRSDQLTAVITGYLLTSITWPYRGLRLRCRPITVTWFFFFEVLGCQGTSFHLIAGSNSQWISLQWLNLYITECNNEIFSISGCFVGSPNETTRKKRGTATRQETPPPPVPPETFLLHLGVTARTHSIGEFNRKFSSSVDNFVIDQWVRVAYIFHLCYSVSRVVEGRCTIKFVACIVEEGKMCCSQGCRR